MDSEPRLDSREEWMRRLTMAAAELKVGERSGQTRRAWVVAHGRARVKRVGDALFDRALGTREGVHALLDHFHPDHTLYEASGWTYLPRVLRPWEVGRDDVFVDLGCGRGRVVFLAARYYAFGRVVGVEISPELAQHARSILERRPERLRCRDVEIVQVNARDWVVPDDVTVIYLYFPFSGETLRAVAANVVASLDRNPRPLRILYAAPKQTEALEETGRFRRVRTSRMPGDYVLSRIAVYESLGVDGRRRTGRPLVAGLLRDGMTHVRVTARELRRTRRLLRDGGVKIAHAYVRPLPLDRGRGRMVAGTLKALGASCLERGLILQAWHAGTGDPRELVIGVSAPGESFAAHAWLDGLEEQAPRDYHEISRLPPPRAPAR